VEEIRETLGGEGDAPGKEGGAMRIDLRGRGKKNTKDKRASNNR